MYHEWTPWEEAFTDQDAATQWLDQLQAGLDVIGLASMSGTPVGMVVGGVADALNAALYAGRGNWAGAGISLLGVIPFVGDAATMGRVAARAADGLASAAREMRAMAGDFAQGWNSGLLRSQRFAFSGPGGALIPLADGVEAAIAGARVRGANTPFAMGLMREGRLLEFAKARGATTWKDLPDPSNWRTGVIQKLSDPDTMVHFNLDGVDVWKGVQNAASGRGGATDWELLQIKQNPQYWDTVQFWLGGKKVENPFK